MIERCGLCNGMIDEEYHDHIRSNKPNDSRLFCMENFAITEIKMDGKD